MTHQTDRDYYRRRAREERRQADCSDDPCARRTHMRMAHEYERRLSLKQAQPDPTAGNPA